MDASFLQNFKALLPSWKFFDRVGIIPIFSTRRDSGEWLSWEPKFDRPFGTLFFNPEGNLTLAKVSLLERVVAELSEQQKPEDFVHSVSYALLREWAQLEASHEGPSKTFQFKVSLRDQRNPEAHVEDVLISLEHEV